MRKFKRTTQSSRFILTGYRAGSSKAACGADATGFKLFHNSTRKCGQDGLKYREILRLYLKPNLEIVEPGEHDIIGTKHGDASAMKRDGADFQARVWTPGRTSPEPGSGAGISVSNDDLVGYRAADMDGDGRDDLVWLRQTGPRSGKLKVALSDGVNYGPAEDWWEGDTVVPLCRARGCWWATSSPTTAPTSPSWAGETRPPRHAWWSSSGGPTRARRSSLPPRTGGPAGRIPTRSTEPGPADLSGDGRADLVIRQDIADGGVKVRTAVTTSPLPGTFPRMGAIKTRFEDRKLAAAKVRMAAGDANRDGRDDVIMLIGGGGRARVERLQGSLLGGFKRVRVWVAPKSDPIPVRSTRLGVGDIDYDGRTDLVLYSERGKGTRVRVLKMRYDRVVAGPDWQTGIPWSSIRPY